MDSFSSFKAVFIFLIISLSPELSLAVLDNSKARFWAKTSASVSKAVTKSVLIPDGLFLAAACTLASI